MKHQLLLQQLGENSTTSPDPVAEILTREGDTITARARGTTFTVSLTEQTTCCFSSDNDMLVPVSKYATAEIELPDWMTCAEYLAHQTEFKYFCGYGGQLTWPRQWFFRLIAMGQNAKFAAIKLLNTKTFRSPFRQSLRSQLEAWLNDPAPRYQSPFSEKQWERILDGYTCLDAKRTSNNLYWRR